MGQWFLSYHSPDQPLAERLKAAIGRKDPALRVFFASANLRAGGAWTHQLAQELAQADAFILLIGDKGIGKWQVPEYYEALDRWAKSDAAFPLIVVLLEGQTAPGLPFLRQLHWIVTPDLASEKDIARIFDGTSGRGAGLSDLWRYAAPYRGLEAMEEKDSDYFFGRTQETVEALDALKAKGRLPVLIGNSGVGKSSLAQAGVLAALKRQAWPDLPAPKESPAVFHNPTMVFSVAEARCRAAQGAGRLLPRHLAIRRHRSPVRDKAAWLDQGLELRGYAVRSDRRHRAPI